ncbi:hypothetical protein [Spiroplasma sp. BIUS-1]|uniref:hypothetical protein n=1 Tax=Spiroplasma sp. BIUS-1 TaxID=216964 RepID=UPI0013995F4B|nr:hypothetical protein [Spiroplasma sp. BIUS-1]QHX36409.1 hypothetical protein SBIUS_v1c01560 [Spiroplasma sp. BIUS-1]
MKDHNQVGNLPTWALVLLIILFLLGLAVAFWGAGSAFGLKKSLNKQELSFFKNKKIINYGETFENKEGIFALFFEISNEKAFFLPIYIFATENFDLEINNIFEDIKNNKKQIIKNYIKENNLKIEQIKFVQLEKENQSKLYEQWLKKIKSNKIIFNQ